MVESEFKDAYERYSGPVFRFLIRFTGDTRAAEEILHDVFLELLSGRYQKTEGATLKDWLFAVAKNRGLNYAKRAVNRKPHASSDVNDDLKTNIEEGLIEKDLHLQLVRAENALAPDLRETWELRKQGLDYQEIADALSIPIGTVKSRFSRLVTALRTEFKI